MSNLQYFFTKRPNETYTISFVGGPVELNEESPKLKLSLDEPISGIKSIDSYIDSTENESDTCYLKKYFKYKNGGDWSDMLPIDTITGLTLNNCNDLDLELYYILVNDGASSCSVYLDDVFINGDYIYSVWDSEAQLPNTGDEVILAPQDTYKVFSLKDFEVFANHDNYDISFRYTQDDSRTYTDWKPLTTENIANTKPNKLRFANFEYLIKNNGVPLMVYDVILTGDFQNVTANYLKTNRYGLKEDCVANFQGTPGNSQNALTDGLSNYGNVAGDINLENESNSDGFWKPYNYTQITEWANTLGNAVSAVAGWTVGYHLSDPDKNGEDKYIHEYTLKNIVDYQNIKIIVPDNKFPNETIIMNQFNLELFSTFEVHIMKDTFKNAFGITKRPAEDDIIEFCETNLLFIVKHAQAFKDVMNAYTYYKVVLEKYENKTNVRNQLKESAEVIKSLADNTTLDSLFGEDNKEEEKDIANKEQFKPKSFEKVRHKISKNVELEPIDIIIDNFETVQSYYDLSDSTIKGKMAIDYKKADQLLGTGHDRSFIFWFNFNNLYDEDSSISKRVLESYNIESGTQFNFLNNYDENNKKGYKIYYQGDNLYFHINDKQYFMNVDLTTNVWYAGLINVNQVNGKIDFNVYRRNSQLDILMFHPVSYSKEQINITDTTGITSMLNEGYVKIDNIEDFSCDGFELIKTEEKDYETTSYILDVNLKLYGSNIKYSNLRVMNKVIEQIDKTNILLENIISKESSVILADNAAKKLITTNYVNKNWK